MGVEGNSEREVDCGEQVERCRKSIFDRTAEFLACADHAATLDAPTGEHDAEAFRPMVATSVAVH